jgi:hypothetical protein
LNDLIHENECKLLQIFSDEICDDSRGGISHEEMLNFLDEIIEIKNDDLE